jgi:hypothetical protein
VNRDEGAWTGGAQAGAAHGQTEPLPVVADAMVPDPDPGRRGLAAAARPVTGGAGLGTDPRLPFWILRVVVAAGAGIAVTIWAGWRIGLSAAALVAIADIIYRSKTMTVIPAAARATSAQRRTRRRLFLLRRAGYVALNARAIPGTDSVIDHLVIGPGGVVALDSERWDRRLLIRASSGQQLYHGPFSQKERLAHARWKAAQAAALLTAELGRRVDVQPAMAIYGPTIPWVVAALRSVDVFAGRRLGKYLRRRSRSSRLARLDPGQVTAVHDAACEALPPA